MKLKIAYGNSRKARKWKNTEITWEELQRKVSQAVITTETVEEYRSMSKAEQADIKDKGGFVGGHLKGGVRRKGNVYCRSFLALDMDYGTPDVWEEKISKVPYMLCVYTTHKHTPEKPRLRLLIPLKREISEAEYGAVARQVAKEIGIDLFDDSTYEAHRLMYWPTRSQNGEFYSRQKGGSLLDPDEYLARYDNWQDTSTWPVSSRRSVAENHGVKKAEDPLAKPGLVGAFCRAYPMTEAIEKFMSDCYEESAVPGRYDYKPASSSAGVVIYEEKFMYSHHATDPLCGRLLNAFDAVRLHRFGNLDEVVNETVAPSKLPSYKAMMDFVRADEKVKLLMIDERRIEAADDFGDDWMARLTTGKNGQVESTYNNVMLILRHDPNLQAIAFNQLSGLLDIHGTLPWEPLKPGWSDTDQAALVSYISLTYNIYAPGKVRDGLLSIAHERKFHPILEYLDALPGWDGVVRVKTLLPRYLGADDTPYVEAVTEKTLVAAVARIYEPGRKFDSVLILNGPQGVGKSTLFAKLGRSWFSDSLTLTDMRDKAGSEKLQSYWILELGELAGMRKMDVETVKSFISRTDDKYRASYGVNVESHPRQCIIVGSTNAETGFLRDITGNRRFWPVTITGESKDKPWDLKDDEVDQIWAEAVKYYKDGEDLVLPPKLRDLASQEQMNALEDDERIGMVTKYLDTRIPENWRSMDLAARRIYLHGDDFEFKGKTVVRTRVSNVEIFAECFGRDPMTLEKKDSYSISAIMRKLTNWKNAKKFYNTGIYGRQRYYEKQQD